MEEIIAVVENGQIKLPPEVHLPDGLTVRVIWAKENASKSGPYDREPLTEEDIEADLRMATGKLFPK
jgi:hypothetical protein